MSAEVNDPMPDTFIVPAPSNLSSKVAIPPVWLNVPLEMAQRGMKNASGDTEHAAAAGIFVDGGQGHHGREAAGLREDAADCIVLSDIKGKQSAAVGSEASAAENIVIPSRPARRGTEFLSCCRRR